jgi:hypothetical protein
MIAVAEAYGAIETRTIDSKNVALFVVWPKPEAVNVSPSLVVRSPLNAIFDEGITWEDAEWQ